MDGTKLIHERIIELAFKLRSIRNSRDHDVRNREVQVLELIQDNLRYLGVERSDYQRFLTELTGGDIILYK